MVEKKGGEDWRERFFVGTLADEQPEWWDGVRALMVFNKKIPARNNCWILIEGVCNKN